MSIDIPFTGPQGEVRIKIKGKITNMTVESDPFSEVDPFGIQKLYPTAPGGQEYYTRTNFRNISVREIMA